MAARFTPLVFPQNLDTMPADYQSKIPLFDGTPKNVPAQKHIDRMADFFNLHEIDVENVTLRLFVQTFGGELRSGSELCSLEVLLHWLSCRDSFWIGGK